MRNKSWHFLAAFFSDLLLVDVMSCRNIKRRKFSTKKRKNNLPFYFVFVALLIQLCCILHTIAPCNTLQFSAFWWCWCCFWFPAKNILSRNINQNSYIMKSLGHINFPLSKVFSQKMHLSSKFSKIGLRISRYVSYFRKLTFAIFCCI